MFKLVLKDELGNSVDLTRSREYSVLEIQGLNPPSATINTSKISQFDGEKFISSKMDMRSINISIAINVDAEKNRIALYKVIKTKRVINVYYENGERNIFIRGYVENFEIDYFAMKQTASISILCPEPYLKNAEELISEISLIIGNFHFPFAIAAEAPIPLSYYDDSLEINVLNVGDTQCGMTIEIRITGDVVNPVIYNRQTREFFGLDYTFKSGDVIYIETVKGNKSVQLLRDSEYINIFNYISKDSKWLQLEIGDNVFTYEAEDDGTTFMEVRFRYRPLYEGV